MAIDVRQRKRSSVERQSPDPEQTRSAYPELTRCDHCQRLDADTMPTLDFADHPGDGWNWLHPECRPLFKPPHVERLEDSKGRLRIEKGRGGLDMAELMTNKPCAYCGNDIGRIQLTAIGKPGELEVHEVYLHPDCERGYIRMTFPEESKSGR